MANLRGPKVRGILLVAFAVVVALSTVPSFLGMHKEEPIYPGPGVTQTKKLSDYYEGLRDTAGDTDVFVLEGSESGGTALLLGGNHPDEPAAYLTAVLVMERATVSKGRLIIIPRSNNSGFTHNLPGEASPQQFPIETSAGTRWFRYGARGINPTHSWPDQEVYIHHPSGQRLSGDETRNLNRAFPGRPKGTLAERIAYGITELIRKEHVDLTIDLHTAMPEYPNINVIVAHERAMPVAAIAQLNLLLEGMKISLAASPKMLHGLTHRELGDFTETLVVLFEAPTISIGRLRGRTNTDTIVKGQDDFYVWGARLGRLFIPFTEEGWPLNVRLARHVTGIKAVCGALGEIYPDKAVVLENLPSYNELATEAGRYFHSPEE